MDQLGTVDTSYEVVSLAATQALVALGASNSMEATLTAKSVSSPALSTPIQQHICMRVCMCLYIYIFIYIFFFIHICTTDMHALAKGDYRMKENGGCER